MTKLSIIIKTFNEEANIARAIESALAVAAAYSGEVIVADSKSTDGTIEVACRYPVRVVQIRNSRERCCGIGPELGLQHSLGEFVLLMDGDMDLVPAFVDKAMTMLDADPGLAGVGGFIREMRSSNLQFKGRARRLKAQETQPARATDALSGGGLYRRSALESVGYMSDRNLHAYEEFDLGRRLLKKDWRLVHVPDHSADHYSYDLGTLALLMHRLRSGSMLGQGEMLRAAIYSGYTDAALQVNAVRISIGLLASWFCVFVALIAGVSAWLVGLATLGGLAGIIALMAVKHRSLASALHSVLVWHVAAGGMILGALRRRRPPRSPIDSTIIRDTGNILSKAVVNG